MTAVLWTLVGVPAVAGAVLASGGRRLSRAAPGVAVLVAAAVLALAVTAAARRPHVEVAFIARGSFGLVVDGLAGAVLVAVAAVTLLVLVFSVGDIAEGRARFFGLMLVFLAAVLLTVTAATLPALLIGWEIMGATSYALIAFDRHDDTRVSAGTTAFLTTRVGDVGLYLAAGATVAAGAGLGLDSLAELPSPWRHVAAAGVLAAAVGKAAQLPLSFWLSRAMLGPSPVSALLHSAAMVAMGGYLLLRLQPLLAATGWAATTTAWVGAGTAVLLGAVAVAQSDLKQLLAASTSAQLGFVFVAAATGGVAGGAAHLIGHAATKALLFLAAGAWLSSLGTRDLRALRGAGRRHRLVGATFTVAALGLAGVPPLALWATKDEIFAAAREFSLPLYVTCLAGAVLSAVYAGKAVGIVLGPLPRHPDAGYDTERVGSRRVSGGERAPLVVLAAGASVLGILALPPVGEVFRRFLDATPPGATATEMLLSGALAVASALMAGWLTFRLPAPAWARAWLGLGTAADRFVARPVLGLARLLARFDDRVLDRAVEAIAPGTLRLARAAARADDAGLDRAVEAIAPGTLRLARSAARADDAGLDRAVRAVAIGTRRLGDLARRPQTGQAHQYYAQAVVGLAAAILVLILVVR
ncbi:proton-conducting transporter membrane subunit [Pseudosporangium ferrugineum]|uniref:NADH:ubiquinone oxidoreductase subunit 5 (Subunit L)/multisubunit Na+/H+ antiporter MnhA subunit n=1 Tax=Pseudosporangium ferrugineum TaxID=439699 RepID=A0A2T0RG98_9ACTN|nr:proton-conducting transporter membrane subunit [Pseudosporangium ferrugineum]PRY20151.1 NADH:ubiquinone oxidoreductase subunit 5 (subunit L)/multisubunit Na+/H+ antiporter MnhA subunit [Pseudosporangium ferrugineum]